MERKFKRGDIYYANLNPVIGSEQGGTRPVLIISNDVGNKHSPTVIVAPITSRIHTKAKLPTHTLINDFEGLDKNSIILLEQVRTIDKQRLRQYLGMIPDDIVARVDKALAIKLKEVDLNKARLEREIDNLPVDTRFRERKIHDMTLRLDALYDTIVELEERIEDAKLRKSSIEMETITLDNIYKLMLNFGKLYDIISDEEKKSLITYLIKEIQIYPNGESEKPLKSIEFNFPIYRDGQEVRRLLWEKGNTVETEVLLSHKKSRQLYPH